MIGMTNARGGGGLYLRVVGGTSKPTSPRENTIWINTSAAVSGYVLSPTQPETDLEGVVWLKIADSGVEINVGKKNAVLLHLSRAAIKIGGKFAYSEGWVYSGGRWTKFSSPFIYLVEDGKPISNVKTAYGTIIQHDGYMTFAGSNKDFCMFSTTQELDDVKILRLEVCDPESGIASRSYYSSGKSPILATKKDDIVFSNSNGTKVDSFVMLNKANGPIESKIYALDVSSLQGVHNIAVVINGASSFSGTVGYIHIKNMWLE